MSQLTSERLKVASAPKTCGAWRQAKSRRKNSTGKTRSSDPLPKLFTRTSHRKEPRRHGSGSFKKSNRVRRLPCRSLPAGRRRTTPHRRGGSRRQLLGEAISAARTTIALALAVHKQGP